MMTEAIEEAGGLTPEEKARLAHLENLISKSALGFHEIGAELIEIREDRLFRGSHDTFFDYLNSRRRVAP